MPLERSGLAARANDKNNPSRQPSHKEGYHAERHATETIARRWGPTSASAVDPVDEVPPPSRLAALGLQHVLCRRFGTSSLMAS